MRIGLVLETPWDRTWTARWAQGQGLQVQEAPGWVVWVTGDAETVARAFGIRWQDDPTGWHTDDAPVLPPGVVAVSGLSTRGRLVHQSVRADALPPIRTTGRPGYAPDQIATAYHTTGAQETGAGQVIALAEWGQTPSETDIAAFCEQLGLGTPTIQQVPVGAVMVLVPGIEATLDGEWALALAPRATLRYYIAPGGTDDTAWAAQVTALLDAVLQDTVVPTVLSISYADGEDRLPATELQGWDYLIRQIQARGTTVLAASGDTGAYGLPATLLNREQIRRVMVPAACPSVLAVGGTALYMSADTYEDERAWENRVNVGASGGGYSTVFARPAYQDALPNPPTGRGVPDIAAVADVTTPVRVLFNGQWSLIGGTSLATPVMAALLALAAEHAGYRFGDLHPWLYAKAGAVNRDITAGNNQCYAVPGYEAGPGWDPVTGWGPILYDKMVANLPPNPAGETSPSVNPADLTVEELAAAPDGKFGPALVPLQEAARTVVAAAAAVGQNAVAAFAEHPVGYYDAVQRAAARLWDAGVRR